MTNVPGPQQPLYLAGGAIDSLMFWVPQSGDIGMGVSILSYNGDVQFGLITDRRLCPDPERVIARFAPEFEKLVLTTLMAPWPREGDLDPARCGAAVARQRDVAQLRASYGVTAAASPYSSSDFASSTSSRSIASAGLHAAASS